MILRQSLIRNFGALKNDLARGRRIKNH